MDAIVRGDSTQSLSSGKQEEVEIEAEALLMDFKNLMDESETKLPEDVNLIVEYSKKNHFFTDGNFLEKGRANLFYSNGSNCSALPF